MATPIERYEKFERYEKLGKGAVNESNSEGSGFALRAAAAAPGGRSDGSSAPCVRGGHTPLTLRQGQRQMCLRWCERDADYPLADIATIR